MKPPTIPGVGLVVQPGGPMHQPGGWSIHAERVAERNETRCVITVTDEYLDSMAPFVSAGDTVMDQALRVLVSILNGNTDLPVRATTSGNPWDDLPSYDR